ncbi:hypothetical protein EVAR_7202_1 [Eumeta japonica]|uniref:DDE-1 domain-containing protein n=1 Tax=Eumeta variegata TaxID=151549 RepID=A0A4C1T320_EUMVA|nr:hypothetical protein EVAR_7202_1 [Eumeta japonica]
MRHGLTTEQVRELSYQYAVHLNLTIPSSWKENNTASLDWLKGFLKRHDETAYTTVTNAPKIVAQADVKRVGQISSTERGSLVTVLDFANAAGGSIPPAFIFPRVHFKEHMLENGPTVALGLANVSGWITEDCFLKALKHFLHFVKPSAESLALIVLENHKTHINVVLYDRKNYIMILTFPPHFSHRLQPLDVTVFGTFKALYRASMNDWMTSNPDEDFLPAFVADRPQSLKTPTGSSENSDESSSSEELPHISSPFIDPELDSNAQTVLPFILSQPQFGFSTLNEPQPGTSTSNEFQFGPSTSNEPQPGTSTTKETRSEFSTLNKPQPGPSYLNGSQAGLLLYSDAEVSHVKTSNSAYPLITPEAVRPFPKALPRKSTGKQRKSKTKVITETPEKDRLLLENMESNKTKNNKKAKKKKTDFKKNTKASEKKKKKVAQKIASSSSSSSETLSNVDKDSDSIDDIPENEEVTPRLRNRSITKDKTRDYDQCNQSFARLRTAFGDEAPFKTIIYNWFAEFDRGHGYLSNEFHDARPSTAENNKNIDVTISRTKIDAPSLNLVSMELQEVTRSVFLKLSQIVRDPPQAQLFMPKCGINTIFSKVLRGLHVRTIHARKHARTHAHTHTNTRTLRPRQAEREKPIAIKIDLKSSKMLR